MEFSFKSISGENVVVQNSNLWLDSTYLKMCFTDFGDVSSTRSEGAQCSCIPTRAASTRLVLLTFAAGSDVSVVVKHETYFVLGKSNR